jgi:hypothetical protein
MGQRYRIPAFVQSIALAAGIKTVSQLGWLSTATAAEEVELIVSGAIPEFPVVWVFSAPGVPSGFVHPLTGATILFSAAGYDPAAVDITGGAINGTPIGATTPSTVKTSDLQATFIDSSGTPGNVTNSAPRGRAAFAAAGTSVVVTSTLVAATSAVFVQLRDIDATMTRVTVIPGAGSFTVTSGAASTTPTSFDFLVVN